MTELWAFSETPCKQLSQRMNTRIQKGTCVYNVFLIIIFSGRWVIRGTISISTENAILLQYLNLLAGLSHMLFDIWLVTSKGGKILSYRTVPCFLFCNLQTEMSQGFELVTAVSTVCSTLCQLTWSHLMEYMQKYDRVLLTQNDLLIVEKEKLLASFCKLSL